MSNKSDDFLREWLAVADSARRPSHSPRGSAVATRLPAGMAALAGIAVIAAVVGSRIVLSGTSGPVVSSSPASSPTIAPSQSAPALTALAFTTTGATSNWLGFSWTSLPADNPLVTAPPGLRSFHWRGGYVISGATADGSHGLLWTSTDGETWRAAPVVAARVMVAEAPSGLVAIGLDDNVDVPAQTVWTSTDGVQWVNAGSPTGLGTVDSLAGTSAGLVAASHTLNGIGKLATSQSSVEFSTDGLAWSPLTLEPGLSWDSAGPQVQAGNGRFFVLGGIASPLGTLPPHGIVWWSDDGRAWTRSGGTVAGLGGEMQFGRDGILLSSSYASTPGGTVLSYSTDGGKTWLDDPAFAPVGPYQCGQGACSLQPDGVLGSNGRIFVAVKDDGHAWTSYDAKTWTPISWGVPTTGPGGFLVLPRGVLFYGSYGAAK